MNRALLCCIPLLLLLPLSASAASPVRGGGHMGVGLGGGLGVSGVSGKYYLADGHAVQAIVGGWTSSAGGGFAVGADYLLEMPILTSEDPFDIGWNLGAGASVGAGDLFDFAAVSGIVGVEFNFTPVPIDLVFEYRPGMFLSPVVEVDPVGFSAHVRYYFNAE